MRLFELKVTVRNQPNKSKAITDTIKENIEKAYSYRQDPKLGAEKQALGFLRFLSFQRDPWYNPQISHFGNGRAKEPTDADKCFLKILYNR